MIKTKAISTSDNSLTGIIFACRFPDDTGFVWNSLLKTYERICYFLNKQLPDKYNFFISYPKISGDSNPKYKNIKILELDLYNITNENWEKLLPELVSNNIKLIIYIDGDPNELKLSILKSSDIKTISWEQSSYPNTYQQAGWKAFLKIILRKFLQINLHDLYIANSENQSRFLTQYTKLPQARIKHIYNCIDTEYFSPSQSSPQNLELPQSKKYIITVCQARAEKRVDILIKLRKKLDEKFPDLVWIYIGAGSMLEEWQELARKLDLTNKFIFIGKQSDVRPYLAISEFMVHAAERESFGYVLIEAMAFEKPVIAFNVGGPAEIILDEQTGKLINLGDLCELEKQVERLLLDSNLAKMWGSSARTRVQNEFSLDLQSQKLSNLIYDLLNPDEN